MPSAPPARRWFIPTRMAEFDVDRERIVVFPIDDEYLFRYFFDRKDIFEQLREYYDDGEYRFAVPADDFEDVAAILREAHFEPVVVGDLREFCVVKEQYTEHADILRNAVAQWQRRGYNFFLMKDELSVGQAIEAGATPIEETDLALGL